MDITALLNQLAAGEIDATEAKRRLDQLGVGQVRPDDESEPAVSAEWRQPPAAEEAGLESDEQPAAPAAAGPAPRILDLRGVRGSSRERSNTISKILVRATGRKVKVVADPVVSTAAAEDIHQIRRRKGVLEILGDKEFSGVVDAISWVKSIRRLDDLKALGLGQELTVRVNPAMEVDLDIVGSSLVVTDLPRLGKIRLSASQATITGVEVVSDLLLQAGQVSVAGKFGQDWSRIRAESGQAIVVIDPASSVVIRADAQLGRITWEGIEVSEDEATIGLGTAHLDLGVVLGHGLVKLGDK